MGDDIKKSWCSGKDSRQMDESMRHHVYKEEENMAWKAHPLNDQIKLKFVLTKEKDGSQVTITHVIVPKGTSVKEHTHEVHDIIYPISGSATIWIKGLGEMKLKKGVLVNVPPGVPHKVYNVTEDMEIFNVFSGAIL